MSNSSATSWTTAHQAPLSIGFPRQECQSDLPFPSPGDLSNPEIEPVSLALAGSPISWTCFSSVHFSHSVMSDSLQPHGLQRARPPCPSPTPRVHPNPCSSSQWCHPTISFSVVPFSSCPQSFTASGSFQMSQPPSGGQIIGVSASTSVFPMNTQDWSPLGWTGWVSLKSKDSQESSPTPQFKSINSLGLSFLYSPTYIHTWPLEKP